MPTRKRRVFISFDVDNDEVLKDFIIGQAKNPDSPFTIENWSLKEAAPEANWLAVAEQRIQRVDSLVIMLGQSTYRAPGVLKEVRLANALNKHKFQIIGYRGQNPTSVPGGGTRASNKTIGTGSESI